MSLSNFQLVSSNRKQNDQGVKKQLMLSQNHISHADADITYLKANTCLTVLGGCAGWEAAASDLLPSQTYLLFKLLNLAVTVSLLLTLHLLTAQVVLHQLNGSNKGLGNAEMSIFL